jgi:poly-gamma-glutamate capsule biosynthesis protein CapA/YwtB (metallophosphatase superfamily)
VCALANNHVLDLGRTGLIDTLDALAGANVLAVGAGQTAARRGDLRLCRSAAGRVLIVAAGTLFSGIPADWAATDDRAGVAYLAGLSSVAGAEIAGRLRKVKRPGDITVASLHWGFQLELPRGRRAGPFRARLSTPASTWCTGTPPTIPAPSRSTVASSSCTAAATSSTTTKHHRL